MLWKLAFLGLVTCLLLQKAQAQQGILKDIPTLASPEASKAQADFRAAAQQAYDAYALALDTSLKAAMSSGDLSEANAINDVKKVIDEGGVPPKRSFKGLKSTQANAAFEAAMAKARGQFTSVLQAEQKKALAKSDLDEANAVQAAIKAVNEPSSKAPSGGDAWESADLVVFGEGFTIATLENNAAAFSNRDYVWKGVPASLQGWRYTKANGGGHPEIKVRAKHNTEVQVFTDIATDAKVDLSGWERVGTQFGYNAGKKPRVVIFKKKLETGQEITIPQGNWAGVLVLLPKQ